MLSCGPNLREPAAGTIRRIPEELRRITERPRRRWHKSGSRLTSSPTCHTCDEASHRNHVAGHPLGAMRVLSSRIGPKSEGETPPEVLEEGRDGSGLGAHRTCHPWRAE